MLVKHGSIERINHFTFKSHGDSQYLEGRIDITQRGAGFVSIDGHERDIYIAPPNTNRALQNDHVKIKIIKEGASRDEGVVVEVIKRDKVLFVGELRISRKEAVLIPDNNRMGVEIIIPLSKINGAKHGQKVLTKITAWPKGSNTPYGEVSADIRSIW